MLIKLDISSPAFSLSSGIITLKAGTKCIVNDRLVSFPSGTTVQLPTLTTGTDYAIYATVNGTVVADANFSAPAGYTAGTVLKIGGFHYAPGGNAAAQAGGDTNPAINPYSIWDLKWRPSCLDPRGMTLVSGGFWADIYHLNTTPDILGTSKYGAAIATGAALPKVAAAFGGDGVASYPDMSWWTASELLAAFGKRLPTQQEFAALAYGVTEASSVGPQTLTSGLDAPRTSRWGVMQATGNIWVWGQDAVMNPNSADAGEWNNDTDGRGQSYIYGAGNLHRSLFGADWAGGVGAGSRASNWGSAPSVSLSNIGARGLCDHLVLV